jgi:hypothetical protein
MRPAAAITAATAGTTAAALVLAALSGGCSSIGPQPCDRSLQGNPYILYTDGKVVHGVYMTSNWDGTDPSFEPDASAPDAGPDAGPAVCGDLEGLMDAGDQGGCAPTPCTLGSGYGLLYLPGGMRYKLEHHLGVLPTAVQVYLSFGNCGAADGDTIAQAAGNQVEIAAIDEQYIWVVNGACAEYWMLVVASAGAPLPTPPGGG